MRREENPELDSLELKPIDDIDSYVDELVEGDKKFLEFEETWGALSQFILDFEFLKDIQNLTQDDIARTMGTKQSAISRVLRMKGKPSYDILRKMSTAVNGSLFISPMDEYSFTVPYELQDRIKQEAIQRGTTVKMLLKEYLYRILDNEMPRTSVPSENADTL